MKIGDVDVVVSSGVVCEVVVEIEEKMLDYVGVVVVSVEYPLAVQIVVEASYKEGFFRIVVLTF